MNEWFERSPFIGFVPWIIYWGCRRRTVVPVVVIVGAMGMTQIYPTRARENARPT